MSFVISRLPVYHGKVHQRIRLRFDNEKLNKNISIYDIHPEYEFGDKLTIHLYALLTAHCRVLVK